MVESRREDRRVGGECYLVCRHELHRCAGLVMRARATEMRDLKVKNGMDNQPH